MGSSADLPAGMLRIHNLLAQLLAELSSGCACRVLMPKTLSYTVQS